MAGKYNFDVLKLRKEDIFEQLTVLHKESLDRELTPASASTICDELGHLKNQFNSLKLDIFKFNAKMPKESDKLSINDFSTFDQMFRSILTACKPVISLVNNSTPIKNSSPVSNSVSLEKLSLSVWNGSISTWNSWYSLFSTAVENNPGLSATQKFLYLKKYLSGEPYAICDQLEVNDINFYEALRLLKDRYQNERRLGSFYLNQLLSYQRKEGDIDFTKYLTVHRSSVAALKGLSGVNDLADFCFFCIAYSNLDSKTQKLFDMSRTTKTIPCLDELLQFVQFAATNSELKADVKSITEYIKKDDFKFKSKGKNKTSFVGLTQDNKKKIEDNCPMCSVKHKLYLCDKFKELIPSERLDQIKKWKRCVNCLAVHHSNCLSKYNCNVCNKRHHTLLHLDISNNATTSNIVGCATSEKPPVLLGTILCEAKDNFNQYIPIKCLFDSGAQTSVVSLELVNKLGLTLCPNSRNIKGISLSTVPVLGTAHINLRSHRNIIQDSSLSIDAAVLKKICGYTINLPPHLVLN